MTDFIRVALAQINPTVGDIDGNLKSIISKALLAIEAEVDLVIFPEMAISGYPPEDLLLRRSFNLKCQEALHHIAGKTGGITAIVGAPIMEDDKLFNGAAILHNGCWAGSNYKSELPNYGVFDERRYFVSGKTSQLIRLGDAVIGVTICEDIWVDNQLVRALASYGANFFVNLSASPFRLGVDAQRVSVVSKLAKETCTPFAYVNLVGGQDELVFDGGSFICDQKGAITDQGAQFNDDLIIADIGPLAKLEIIDKSGGAILDLGELTPDEERKKLSSRKLSGTAPKEAETVYKAITLGVRDYVRKNNFESVVIALSGGIDSALTASIAVDALGSDKVNVISMPSPYSSEGSVTDAKKLAENLGLELESLPIDSIMEGFDNTLKKAFADTDPGLAEENIQARIRGAIVMALSNKFGQLVLATGNKSEIAVGYCTLYGDMAGGFAVIKDVFKTKVYDLCHWRNDKAGYDLIPNEIIAKEPSAELRPDQKDSDSLPTYDKLDPILEEYIERDKTVDEIVNFGYSRSLVVKIVSMVDRNEYKRRQGPIGVKITAKAFGRDRRLPITNHFKDR